MKAEYSNYNENDKESDFNSEKEEAINQKQNEDNKREKMIKRINKILRKYSRENEQITIFISMLYLFRKKKYQCVECYEMYNHLLNSYNKDESKFNLRNKINIDTENRKQILNNFLDEIDYELNNNDALNVVIIGEDKMIELNLSKTIEIITKKNKKKNNDKNAGSDEVKNDENKRTFLKKKIRRNSLPKNENNTKKKKIKDKNVSNDKNYNNKDNKNEIILEEEETNTKKRAKSSNKNEKKEKNKIKENNLKEAKKENEKTKENINLEEAPKPSKKGRPKAVNKKIDEAETKTSKSPEIKPYSEEVKASNNNNPKEKEIKFEEIPKLTEDLLAKIGKTKMDLDNFELKLKNMNTKILELQNNKKEFNNIKKLLDESQEQLNNIYSIMENWLNSLKIFKKMENYDQKLYNSHKYTVFSYKKYYLDIANKIKDYIGQLNLIESKINTNKKDIKEYYENIVLLNKEILGNINFDFESIINIIKKEEKYDKVDEILNDIIKKGDILLEEINEIEKSQSNNEITETKIEEEKSMEKEESVEPKDSTEAKELSSVNKESVEEKE